MTTTLDEPMVRVAAVLDEAANEIERRGLWQGFWWNTAMPPHCRELCTLGAIITVIREADDREVLTDTVTGVMHEYVITHYVAVGVADWNDTPGRTKAEVVDALRAASKWSAQA